MKEKLGIPIRMSLRHGWQRNTGVQKAMGTWWLRRTGRGWKGVTSREVCPEDRKSRYEEGKRKKKNENQPSAFLEKSRGSVQELLANLGCLLMSTMDETQTKLDAILILPAAREQAPVLGRVRVRLCGEDALVSTAQRGTPQQASQLCWDTGGPVLRPPHPPPPPVLCGLGMALSPDWSV